MIKRQPGHLKHADAAFAVQDLLELAVGPDKGLVGRVLEAATANIIPKLARDLGAGQGFVADDLGQLLVRNNRREEARVVSSSPFKLLRCNHKLSDSEAT